MLSNNSYQKIGEHHVLLPPCPKDKKQLFFWDEKKSDQFWDRKKLITRYKQIWFDFLPKVSKSPVYTKMWQPGTLYDSDGLLVSLNEEDSNYIDSIYIQERDRRLYGVWFFNNGEPTWITGAHYYFLMYARMQRSDGEGLFGDYREFQGDYFKLLQHCRVSPHILGLICSKPKKTGITNAHWSGHYLNRATLYRNKNLGYMNINSQQAAKTFNDYFMFSYNGLISPLKPETKLLSLVEGTIVFGQSHNGSKKVRKPNAENEDDLNTSVFCVASKPKAFDVAVMDEITIDEPTKIKESFAEIWRTNKEAVRIQSKINGKATLFNYTEGEDTISFRETRDVFWDSKLKTITDKSHGQTKSGLIAYHIPAYGAWEGAFDRYGKCEEKRAYEEIEFERSKVKNNKRALQAITRQYANDEREAWGSAGAGSTFDNLRLGDLLTDVELDIHDNPESTYTPCKLEWMQPLWNIGLRNKRRKGEFCPVRLVPLTIDEVAEGGVGKCRLYEQIPQIDANLGLKFGKDEDGCLIAPPQFKYVAGFDPTNYAAGSEVIEGSKNGGYVMNLPDERIDSLLGKVKSKVIVLEYYDRPELPDEAFEDILKIILYFGAIYIVEGNAPYVATRLMEEGLGNFCFIKDENGILTQWKRWMGLPHEKDKSYQLIRTTANSVNSREILETIVRIIKNYIEKPPEGEKDYGKTIKSERLLRQLVDFDPEDTKCSDLVMAFGYTLLTLDLYSDSMLKGVDDLYGDANFAAAVAAIMR